ncbi:MAG: hypothetical protein E6Q32_01315 [Neisseriales bacterium]|nr:MAG: hypothetical protein E6Q32_01315 [Neisseriales bacterium]
MKTQKLKPIACVLAVSIFLAGCNGGRSTADGASNSLQAAQAIVNNNDANHAAFIERVKNAVKGPVNYEVINRDFYTPKDIKLAFDPNLKSNQLASEKSLNVSDEVNMGITVVSGAVAFVPVVGPILSIAVAAFAGPLIDAFTTPEPAAEYDPNNITAQLSRLQSKVTALEQQMAKTNNIFYQSLKEQSTNTVNSAQHKLFSAMAQISYAPNLNPNAGNCMLSTSDLAYHYFGYSGLGFDEFGTSCNSETELDFMGVAKDLAAYSSDLSISISDKQSFADAMVNISAAKIDAGYNGDFSKVTQVTNANQSALIQVLDSMFTNLKTQLPAQGAASKNYADTIAQYNASLVFILQSAYNSLQGAYAIEHTNNYLNFLAAVNALQTNSKATIPQISGYEGIQAINFEVKKVTTLKDLEDDYINKENNLLMLYTARTNIMFNTVYKYTVSDNPLTTKTLPAVPTSYTVDGKSYKYEVALRPYSEMYPKHYTTLDISNLPRGGLGESGIFYTFGGYSNYYVCGYGVKPADLNDKNCSLYPVAESGFYDGDRLMFKVKPGQYANLPDNLKNASTISTDWYVGARGMPFKFSECEHPSAATASFVESNDSFRCDSYKTWEPAITNTDAIRIFHNNTSPNTEEYDMTKDNDRGLSIYGDVLKQHVYTGEEISKWSTVAKFSSDKFLIDGDTGLKSDTFTLLSTSSASSYDNYVLNSKGGTAYSINTKLNANIGDGGSYIFNASCPYGVDSKTDFQRYESGNSIQPSYISCKVLSQNDDAAIFEKYLDTDEHNLRTPALIVYNGSKSFVLKTLYETYYMDYADLTDSGLDSVSLITQAIIPCSEYPQYCKAD